MSWFSAKDLRRFLSYRSCSIMSSNLGRAAYQMSSPQPRGGGWPGDGHHGSQGTGSSGSKGMVEGSTLSQLAPGVLQSCMDNAWGDECQKCLLLQKAAEEMLHMMCSVQHWGTCSVLEGPNLDYNVRRQLCKDLSEIQCCHHKSQEWF